MTGDEFKQTAIIAIWAVIRETGPELTAKEVAKKTREDVEKLMDEFRSDFNI